MLLLAACADKPAPGTPDDTGPAEEVDPGAPTWYGEVGAVVQANCSRCHQPGGAAFDLTDPERAAGMAGAMAAAVEARTMPPWGAFASEDCVPTHAYAGDPTLSDADIGLLRAWADAGAPLGEGEGKLEADTSHELSGEVAELSPATSFRSSAAQDEFRCFAVNPAHTEDLWVDALDLLPSNAAIAHHALFYAADAALVDAEAGADGWYSCPTGSGIAGAQFLSTWVPGSGPTYAPAGTGLRIPAGTQIVVQMHYHPGGTANEEDLPTVRYRRLAEPARYELHNTLIGNFVNAAQGLLPGPNEDTVEFRIPAGAAGHTEEMLFAGGGSYPNLPIANIGAHMHLVGTSMEVWIERTTPDAGEDATQCLLPATRYDYDWQFLYASAGELTDMPMVSGGDNLRIRCTYDNTLDNPGVVRALSDAGEDEPVDVYLGEGTLDEMCIVMFGYVY